MRSPPPFSPNGDDHSLPNQTFFIASAASSSLSSAGKQQLDQKMANKHKFYEYYTLGCVSVRTESLALCVAVQFLLTNGFLIWLSLQGWHPYWRLALPAVFNVGAALALVYAWWADKSSYSLLFLIVNGLSICALALALFVLLLVETDPSLLKQFVEDMAEQDGGANYVYETVKGPNGSEHVNVHKNTIAGAWRHYAKQLELSGWLRESELGLVLVLLLLWMAQGIVCHFYRYAKLRKVERFERMANGCNASGASARVSASRSSGTNFRIPVATLRRLQHVQQQQQQKSKY